MRNSFSLPPISVHKNTEPKRSDSFNLDAFKGQVSQRRSFSNYFSELSKLSARADYLKQENELLKQELFDIVTSPEQTNFHRIKKNILAITAKLTIREKETLDVAKAMSAVRKASQPTLLKNYLPKDDNLVGFDYVADSILIANPQKNFFPAGEIENQNKEIRKIIKELSEQLNRYKKRLNLYEKCQTENTITLTMESLKRGENPLFLADAAPAEVVEQREKIKLLREELKQLVTMRQRMEGTEGTKSLTMSPRSPKSPKSPRFNKTAPRPKIKKTQETTQKEQEKAKNLTTETPNEPAKKEETESFIIKEEKTEKTDEKKDDFVKKEKNEKVFDELIGEISEKEPPLPFQDKNSQNVQKLDDQSDVSECFEDELLPNSPVEETTNNYNEFWKN